MKIISCHSSRGKLTICDMYGHQEWLNWIFTWLNNVRNQREDRISGLPEVDCFVLPLVGFPGGSVVKNPPANVGDAGSVPGWGTSPGEGSGYPLQYSCLGIPWTKEPNGLQSMGSQRVRHDLGTKQQHSLWQVG